MDAMRRNPLDVEELLRHQRWVRRLAGSLVADPRGASAAGTKVVLTWRPPGVGRSG